MAEGKGTNTCGCDKTTCSQHNEDGVCADPTCKVYKSCCEPGCDGCKVKRCEKGECKCRIPSCGCKNDCYKAGGKCNGKAEGCKRCEDRKCEKVGDGKCICYRCSCGTQCNGVICSCCSWCDPRNCSGRTCDGYVIGRCRDQGKNKCEGHVRYEGDTIWDRNQKITIKCDSNSHDGDCNDGKCNKWLCGELQPDGYCLRYCKYCGTLCGQDKFRRCCYIAIPVVIIVLAFLIFRFMLPEKFQAVMSTIRAAFPTSPRHPSRYLSNLVGDKIPEETKTYRYPAFRPRAYAGLA